MMGLISGFGSPLDFSNPGGNRVPRYAIAQPETAERTAGRVLDTAAPAACRPSVVVVIVDVDVSVLAATGARRRRHILEDRVTFAVEPLLRYRLTAGIFRPLAELV